MLKLFIRGFNMKKVTYYAVFERSKDGFGVYFPDLPGCISFGEDYEEALSEAREALSLHLYGMEKDGDDIPEPSKTVTMDDDIEKGSFISPVSVYPEMFRHEMDSRPIDTNVPIPAWLKELAEQNSVNYSVLLEDALCDVLNISMSK